MLSFFWDITRWNRLGIRIATGGKPNQSTGLFLHFEKIWHPWRAHNAMHVSIDWTCQIISSQILGCGLVSIDRYAWYCVRHGFRIISKCKKKCCTFVWFSSRSNPNTQPISVCDISKERKQISAQIYNLLFLSRGYTLRVIIEWIYCTVTFCAHCRVIYSRTWKLCA